MDTIQDGIQGKPVPHFAPVRIENQEFLRKQPEPTNSSGTPLYNRPRFGGNTCQQSSKAAQAARRRRWRIVIDPPHCGAVRGESLVGPGCVSQSWRGLPVACDRFFTTVTAAICVLVFEYSPAETPEETTYLRELPHDLHAFAAVSFLPIQPAPDSPACV